MPLTFYPVCIFLFIFKLVEFLALLVLQKHLTEMSMLQNISMEQESKSSVDVYQDESMNIEGK